MYEQSIKKQNRKKIIAAEYPHSAAEYITLTHITVLMPNGDILVKLLQCFRVLI